MGPVASEDGDRVGERPVVQQLEEERGEVSVMSSFSTVQRIGKRWFIADLTSFILIPLLPLLLTKINDQDSTLFLSDSLCFTLCTVLLTNFRQYSDKDLLI